MGVPAFDKDAIKARFERLWSGTIPLKELFWIYLFLPAFVFSVFAGMRGLPGLFFAVASFGWCAYMARPVIVAADQYQGDKRWAIVTKAAVILVLLSTLFQLFSS